MGQRADRPGLTERVVIGFALLSAAAVNGCAADAPPDTPAFEVRDSAGVQIVTSHRGTWGPDDGWTVASSPSLVIGRREGDPAYEFSNVRGALRMPDGGVAVAELGTSDIRLYGPDGTHLRSVGGAGDGPGEFSSLAGIFTRGDTLFAHDWLQSRITFFDFQGEYLGDVKLESYAGLPLVVEVHPVRSGYLGVLPDLSAGEIKEEFSYKRGPLTYRMYDDAGRPLRVVDELPGQELLIRSRESGNGSTVLAPLVSHTAYQTVVDGRLVAGTTDGFEIRVYDEGGALRRLIRAPGRDSPVPSSEWDEVVAEELERFDDADRRRRVLDMAEAQPAPDVRPAFGRFVADPPDHVWIAPYRPVRGRPVPWTVVELDGTVLGEVDLPEGFTPLDIGPRSVFGAVTDELGVPYMHLLERSR